MRAYGRYLIYSLEQHKLSNIRFRIKHKLKCDKTQTKLSNILYVYQFQLLIAVSSSVVSCVKIYFKPSPKIDHALAKTSIEDWMYDYCHCGIICKHNVFYQKLNFSMFYFNKYYYRYYFIYKNATPSFELLLVWRRHII